MGMRGGITEVDGTVGNCLLRYGDGLSGQRIRGVIAGPVVAPLQYSEQWITQDPLQACVVRSGACNRAVGTTKIDRNITFQGPGARQGSTAVIMSSLRIISELN